jgi:hypothetical protein
VPSQPLFAIFASAAALHAQIFRSGKSDKYHCDRHLKQIAATALLGLRGRDMRRRTKWRCGHIGGSF